MEPLLILRSVVVLLHLVGFAILFGSWFVEAVAKRFQPTRLMNLGLGLAGIAGLALAAPWPAGIEMNYPKIAVKLVVLIVIGALIGIGTARQRKGGTSPAALFWLIGLLTLANAAIALLWR